MTTGIDRVADADPTSGGFPRDFDVRAFALTAEGSHRASIHLDAFAAAPLAPTTLRVLRYLRDAERATMTHLRNVLVTPTHKDARVTAFLTTWAFEKYWIADALDVVLRAHPALPEPEEEPLPRVALAWRDLAERLRPIRTSLVANSIGEDVIAAHMTLGTVDEWVTSLWYDRAGELARHPELDALLARIRRVKTRHLEFFEQETRHRLARSPRARRLSASVLARTVLPVGSDVQPAEETEAVLAAVLRRTDARLALISGRIDSLPGQSGAQVVAALFDRTPPSPLARVGSAVGRAAADAAGLVRRA